MKMSGEEIIPASIGTVWKAPNDAAVLKRCIPGCESINKTSNTSFTARVVAKVGPVKAGFDGSVQLKDLNPPRSYRIEGKGEGGLAGFATGGATVNLEEVPEGTRLTYDVDAQVGGKIAMLGSRLIDSAARSIAGQFFDNFAKVAASMPGDTAVAAKAAKPARAKVGKKAANAKTAKKKASKKTAAPKKKAASKRATKKNTAKKASRKKR